MEVALSGLWAPDEGYVSTNNAFIFAFIVENLECWRQSSGKGTTQ